MKQAVLFFIYFLPKLLSAQFTVTPIKKLRPDTIADFLFIDTFENELSSWTGEVDKFQIENQLLLNSENARSPSFLHTPSTEIRNKIWEVGIEVNGLLTTQNNVRLYLAATNDSLPGNQHGYYLQIDGASGNHTYKLYKQNNATRTLLFQSKPTPTQGGKLRARVRVTCTINGEWRIYIDEYDQGVFNLVSDQDGNSAIRDLSHESSLFSGWMTRFSSTRKKDYILHYFLINELEDIPPIHKEPTYKAKPYDVIINEIMADPSNSVGLPEIEYVELKNLTNEVIHLKDWTYSSLTRTHRFENDSILPHSILVLYRAQDSLSAKDYGHAIGLSSWPILVNTGTTLSLNNEDGLLIDEVTYKPSWYKDSQKSKGGWSLERIDPYLRCNDDENWIASIDTQGGTPGRENSVYQEKAEQEMAIANLEFISSTQLNVTFNRNIEPMSASLKTIYRINNGMGIPDSVEVIDHKNIALFYFNEFIRGQHHKLSIEDIADCIGVKTTLTEEIFLPERITPRDVLINEVLADPFKDGVEFVEIYNNSNHTLNLNTLYIGTVSESTGAINIKRISFDNHLIPPASYRLLSPNSKVVAMQYINSASENFIEMESFPQLKNSNGTIVLMDGNTQIDRFDYHENMHDALISDKKGVSLERMSFNIPTNEAGNFRSAAAAVGYATPGYKNSQVKEISDQQALITLTSKTFSPDNDGFEDLLEINYHFETEEDVMATIEIYNTKGVLVRTLTKNHRLANNGRLYWNGLMDNTQLAGVGIYIVVIELYNAKGMRKIVKESCVLASKF